MAVYTFEVATDIVVPNITVYRILKDGALNGYRINANEGYVFYDSTETNTEMQIDPDTGDVVLDPETGLPVEVPVTYYYTVASLPLSFDFTNCRYIAVPRDSVDENYIFGVGDSNHEAM